MRYLLDTNTCIAVMRSHSLVVQKMRAATPAECAVSTITSYELYTGVEKCSNPAQEAAKVDLLLKIVCQAHFDLGAARQAAKVRVELESQGTPIGPYDILLAGHALELGLTFVTGNTKEFNRVSGLSVENWQV